MEGRAGEHRADVYISLIQQRRSEADSATEGESSMGVRARSPKSPSAWLCGGYAPLSAVRRSPPPPRATRSAFGAWPRLGEGGRVGLGSGRRVVRSVDGGWQLPFFVRMHRAVGAACMIHARHAPARHARPPASVHPHHHQSLVRESSISGFAPGEFPAVGGVSRGLPGAKRSSAEK